MPENNTESQPTPAQPTTTETTQTSTVASPANPMETTSELYQSPLETSQNSWRPASPTDAPLKGVIQKMLDK